MYYPPYNRLFPGSAQIRTFLPDYNTQISHFLPYYTFALSDDLLVLPYFTSTDSFCSYMIITAELLM